MQFPQFSAEHDDMDRIAQAILAHVRLLVAGAGKGGDDALPAMRMALSRQVANHCAAEIAELRDHLHAHPDVAVQCAAMVRRYHDELLAWRGALMECNANWSTRRIEQEPAAFLQVFSALSDALQQRIRWEEQEFYPKVLGRVSTPA